MMPADVVMSIECLPESGRPGPGPRILSAMPRLEAFRWRRGRYTVTLTGTPDGWLVRHTCASRFIGGGTEVLYEKLQTSDRHACWDVMTRVIRSTDDQDSGVKACRDAAAWINGQVACPVPALAHA